MTLSSSQNEIGVVGIGSSAGGLEALRSLLSSLKTDTGLAFVAIQHLKSDQESHLRDILAQSTRMRVRTIENGDRIEPNVVFVAPPGFDVVLSGDFLNLNPRGESLVHRLGIDFFFSTLSQSRKSKAIGVVLSGSGSDGTLGLKAIKSEGGISMVQDPKTAQFDSMPRSAIAAGMADLILSPAAIAEELERLAKHPYSKVALLPNLASVPEEFPVGSEKQEERSKIGQILEILLSQTRIDFSQYKMSTIRRRIERQMMLRKVETIEKYAEYLKKNVDEVKALYEDIFIHVTDFFRDPEAYRALRQKVFPMLVKDRDESSPIRVWVPGCATGEEVYSLVISLLEYFEERSLSLSLNVFAGDISEPALAKARKGVYADYQMGNVSRERLERFFEKVKGGYKVNKATRDLCIFSRHDVTNNPPIPKVDLISCRNVLIYFSADLQKRVFPVFHYALNPNGFLWLGRAESPESASRLFTPVDKTHKIFSKVQCASVPQPRFSAGTYSSAGPEILPRSTEFLAKASDSVRSVDQILLYRYTPPSVVVDSNFDILQFRGRTAPFLDPAPGLASNNLLKMVHPDLMTPLRFCLQAAKKNEGPARKENIVVEQEGKAKKVHIEVLTVNPLALDKERQFLVVFEDPTSARIAQSNRKPARKARIGSKEEPNQLDALAQYNAQLLQELETTREYQQSLIEEYEAAQEELTSANEELRSTNEELQSTNEELHSTNEELGTAKEELQAANEELLSTNEELQRRNADLETALRNLENSEQRFRLMVENVRDYAIFMLDTQGNVATWNEGAQRIKGYTAFEVIGKHFSMFYPEEDQHWKPKLELEEAIRVGRFEDLGWRIKKDGSRFWANVVISAIRDSHQRLVGFAKVTRDLTERKRAEEELLASRKRFEELAKTFDTALSSSQDFYYVFDRNHRFTYVNRALLKLWGKTLEEVVGKTYEELGYPPELVQLHQSQLNEVLTGKIVHGENTYTNYEGREGYYEYVFVPVLGPNGEVQVISGTTRDVTERRQQEQARLDEERRTALLDQLQLLANSIPQLAWMAAPDGSIFWYNERWYKYTGTTPEQMEGWGWQSVHDPSILPSVLEGWKKSLSTETPFEMEFPLRGADGRFRWFLTQVNPVHDRSGKLVRWFGTNTDIHERRQVREELQKAVASRDEFLSIASHELKTPVTAVKLQLQNLVRFAKNHSDPSIPRERVVASGEKANQEIKRLTSLMDDLLDVSRIRAGRLKIYAEETDLTAYLAEIIERQLPALRAVGCESVCEFQPSVTAAIDRTRIEQVISNIISNIIKYAPGKPVTFRLKAAETEARIEIEDQGPGIQNKEIVFGRFERADADYTKVSGLGLGLYISRQIVESHRGKIYVDPDCNEGCRFIIELPIRGPSEESAEK